MKLYRDEHAQNLLVYHSIDQKEKFSIETKSCEQKNIAEVIFLIGKKIFLNYLSYGMFFSHSLVLVEQC